MSGQVDTVDKAFEVGNKFLADIQKQKEDASIAAMSDEQRQQREEDLKKQEADSKAQEERNKKVEELAYLDDDEIESLSDDEKKLREDALNQFEETDDDFARIKRANKKNLKRIDKLTAKNKELEDKILQLEQKYTDVDNKVKTVVEPKKDLELLLSENQKKRIDKYIEEDKGKEFKDRREIAEEELDDWFAENPRQAAEWLSKRDRRREQEILHERHAHQFIGKQEESIQRLRNKFPGVTPNEQEVLALKNQGRTKEEVMAFLHDKYPELKICDQIVAENPTWLQKENFGDLVIAEMEKRVNVSKQITPKSEVKKQEGMKMYSEEDVSKMVEDRVKKEIERRDSIDNGDSSTVSVPSKTNSNKLTKEEEYLVKQCRKGNMTDAQIESVLERHRSNKSSRSFEPDEDDNAKHQKG